MDCALKNADADVAEPVTRACAYVRVSTTRQAEHETSLADQIASIERHCASRGIEMVEIYREPGASATDDNRPMFRAMIEAATGAERPYDMIVVHSFSRFFRDQFEFERYRRQLQKAKVELISITQDVGEGHMADLIRSILNKFDEYQSQENAKHVRRSMAANARDGFWNGARPPLGYLTVVVERRRDKDKKKLAIDESEAPLVRKIFDLYLRGDGRSGPMGGKKIVSWLNERGYTYRGKLFHVSNVDAVLRRTTYMGLHHFNQTNSRTGERRPREQWVAMEVPAIIAEEDFQAVQARLAERNPRRVPPRVVSGPTMLIGIAKCGCESCGGALTIRTGKSGQYRYYACSRRAARGATVCPGQSIRMEKLDATVLEALERRILQPDRLTDLLSAFLDHSEASNQKRRQDLTLLRSEKTNTEGAINRLYELIEQGLASPADTGFAERLTRQRQRLEMLTTDIALLERQLTKEQRRITPETIARFGTLLRTSLRDGDPALRQGYVRLLVDEVEVSGNEIRIRGSKKALEHAVLAAANSPRPMVPSFARKWRARNDSNVRPSDS